MFLRRHVISVILTELLEPSAAGRIENSSDLFVELYCHSTFIYFPVETVDLALTFESWASEKGVNSK